MTNNSTTEESSVAQTDTPRTDLKELELSEVKYPHDFYALGDLCRELEQELAASKAEVERLKLHTPDPQAIVEIAREQQDSLKKLVAEIGTVRLELIVAQESEAVWKTEADKADQRRLEAEAEVERLKIRLEEAIEIAEDLSSGDAWKFTAADEKLAALKGEIK
jgi:hypothetical protein